MKKSTIISSIVTALTLTTSLTTPTARAVDPLEDQQKDYVHYHYRAPGGLFSTIYQHFEERGERLGEHWYDMDGISNTYQGIIGDKFFNPTEFLMAAFDRSTTTSVLTRMTMPFQPYQQEAAQEEAETLRVRQVAEGIHQREVNRQLQQQAREDQVRQEEAETLRQQQAREDLTRLQEFERQLQEQTRQDRLEAERIERERLELLGPLPNTAKEYANYHYRAPGGLFSTIYQHFEERGERLGEHWYDMDGISNTYQGIIGDKFFNPTEFLMAAFDRSTTTSVLNRMTLPFQPRTLKDYVHYHYRAPGGLFSTIYQHFEERGERLGEHWYDMDGISNTYQGIIGDKFFNPTEFLMAAFDHTTTTSVLNRMTLPFQPRDLKDYVHYHYRAPGGLFSTIYQHFEERGERLGEHWYDMDAISAIYQESIGDRFFNPTEFLMAAFDRSTTTSVLTRMTMPFQPYQQEAAQEEAETLRVRQVAEGIHQREVNRQLQQQAREDQARREAFDRLVQEQAREDQARLQEFERQLQEQAREDQARREAFDRLVQQQRNS